MKEFNYVVKIDVGGFGIEAKNTKEAIRKIKDMFKEDHSWELMDYEIVECEEVER